MNTSRSRRRTKVTTTTTAVPPPPPATTATSAASTASSIATTTELQQQQQQAINGSHRKRGRHPRQVTMTTAPPVPTPPTSSSTSAAVVDDDCCNIGSTTCGGATPTGPNSMSSAAHHHNVVSPVRSSRRPTKKICRPTRNSIGCCGTSSNSGGGGDSAASTAAVSATPSLSGSTIPASFICPLTMEVMVDPVLDTEGNSYERSAIRQWLRQSRTSPLSRQPLTERMLVPNVALKSVIHEVMGERWVKEQQEQQQQQTLLVEDSGRCSVMTPLSGPVGFGSSTGLHQHNIFRAKIDCFLQHTCRELGGLQLRLNEDGCCAFRYESITVVLDVPATVGVFCLYTKHLVDLDKHDNDNGHNGTSAATVDPRHRNDLLCRRALALNFLQGDTRGGCLSIRSKETGDEIMFSYTDRVPEVSARDFSNILLNFVETSVVLREKLLKAPLEDNVAMAIARHRGTNSASTSV